MAFLMFNRHEYTFTPVSYSVDETKAVRNMLKGEMVFGVHCITDVAFNGSGGRTFKFGTSGTNGLFADSADVDITTAGTLTEGVGAAGRYANVGRYTFTADGALNIYFTAATGGSPTVGQFRLIYYTARVSPN